MGTEARSHASLGADLAGLQRLPALMVDLLGHRLHHQQSEKQRQPHQHLIRGRGLRTQRLPQKVQHHHHAQERRDRHENRGQQSQHREQQDDLHGHAQRLAGFVLKERNAEQGIGRGGGQGDGGQRQQE